MDCGLIFEEPRGSFAKDQGRLRSGLVLVDRIRWISIQWRTAARLSWRATARLGHAAPGTGEQLAARRWLGRGSGWMAAAQDTGERRRVAAGHRSCRFGALRLDFEHGQH